MHKENLKGLLRQQATTKQQIRVVSLQLEDSALSLRAACEALVESEQHFAAMSSQLTYLEGTSVAPVPSHQPPPAEAAGSSTPAVDTAVAVDLSSPDDLGLRDPASPAFEVLLVCERWWSRWVHKQTSTPEVLLVCERAHTATIGFGVVGLGVVACSCVYRSCCCCCANCFWEFTY